MRYIVTISWPKKKETKYNIGSTSRDRALMDVATLWRAELLDGNWSLVGVEEEKTDDEATSPKEAPQIL